MYSAVLMMALAGAGESPECGHLFARCGGCSGYYGCSGYGCSGYGCSGYGGCHGFRHGCSGYYGCGGCYGGSVACFGYCSGSLGYYGTTIYPSGPVSPPMVPAGPMPPAPGGAPILPLPSQTRVPASIQVNLPSDAVVYFDGFRTAVSGNRRFTTPGLEPGKTYFYTVKIEMNRDGQTLTTTERVLVRAGDEALVSVNVSPSGSMTARQN